MTTVQRVARAFGIVFILVAILGFFASRGSMEADPALAPKLLGLFPVNLLHNLVHLAFGLWGVTAARSWGGAKSYCTWAGTIYVVLALLGFVIPSTFGLIPIGGNDIWLHALIGVVLLGVGRSARQPAPGAAAQPTAEFESGSPGA